MQMHLEQLSIVPSGGSVVMTDWQCEIIFLSLNFQKNKN